jgi:hypothetical protein
VQLFDAQLPPVINSLPNHTTAYVGDTWTYHLIASDPNGDPLSYSIIPSDSAASVSANGVVTWTPSVTGPLDFQVAVSDGRGGRAVQSLHLKSVDPTHPPQILNAPSAAVTIGQQLHFSVETNPSFDLGGVTLELSDDSIAMGFQLAGNVFTWEPHALGTASLEITALDDNGSSFNSFPIRVLPVIAVSNPPIFTSMPPGAATVGVQWSYSVNAAAWTAIR